MPKTIYDFPDVYDRVLCHRPEIVRQEVETIAALLAERGIRSGRVLELACGTCAHSVELAARGFECSGLDRSAAMLQGAAGRAGRHGVHLDLREADVVDFEWPHSVDAAIFMSETFPLITQYQQLRSLFDSVRRALRSGGCYIVDVDAHRHGVGVTHDVWGRRTVEIDGGSVEIWHESFPGDWIQGTARMKMHCRIRMGDSTHETEDEWITRVDSPWNLRVLVESFRGWKVDGFYSWRDGSTALQDEDHCFMLAIR